MGRLTFGGDRLVYSSKKYNISNMSKHMFSTMENVTSYVINNPEFDKVIFVIRHSIRNRNDWSNDVKLTALGVHGAERAGLALHDLPGEMSYYSTDTVRTKQTAYYLAQGRNIEVVSSINDIQNIDLVATDLNYIKTERDYDYLVKKDGYTATWYNYMYDGAGTGTAFNDIKTVSDAFIASVLTRTTTKNNILVSHDQNVMPLLVYSLNKLIDFRANERWLNYLSGIAILQKGDEISIMPVTGLLSGYN